jgi:uncharacterized membrane protein YqjE
MSVEIHREEQPAPATGLFHSLSSLVGTVIGIAHTRLELLTTELREEVQQAAKLLVWALIAAFAVMMALFLGALSVVFAFWDTHRLLAALIMVGFFVALALVAVLILQHRLRTKPPLLDATLGELVKDREKLRTRI